MDNPNFPFSSAEAREQFERRTAELGRQMKTAIEAFGKAFTPVIQQHMRALKPLIEWANSPEGKAAITAYYAEHGIYPRVREVQGCNCFCTHNHPGEQVCLGEVDAAEVRTVRYGSDVTGPVDVPMCPPCADAVLAATA